MYLVLHKCHEWFIRLADNYYNIFWLNPTDFGLEPYLPSRPVLFSTIPLKILGFTTTAAWGWVELSAKEGLIQPRPPSQKLMCSILLFLFNTLRSHICHHCFLSCLSLDLEFVTQSQVVGNSYDVLNLPSSYGMCHEWSRPRWTQIWYVVGYCKK